MPDTKTNSLFKKGVYNIASFPSFSRTLLTTFAVIFFLLKLVFSSYLPNLLWLQAIFQFRKVLFSLQLRGTFPVWECSIQIFECKHTSIALILVNQISDIILLVSPQHPNFFLSKKISTSFSISMSVMESIFDKQQCYGWVSEWKRCL